MQTLILGECLLILWDVATELTLNDSSDALSLGGNVESQLSSFGNNSIGTFNFTRYTTETSKPIVSTQLDSFISALTVLNNSVNVASFTHYTGVQSQNLADFQAKLTVIIRQMNSTRDFYIPRISNSTQFLNSGIRALQYSAQNATLAVPILLSSYQNLSIAANQTGKFIKQNINSVTVPALKAFFISFASINATDILTQGLSCANIALDLQAVQNAVCTNFLGGLDGIWFGLYLAAFIYVFAITGMFRIATHFMATNMKDVVPFKSGSKLDAINKSNKSLGSKADIERGKFDPVSSSSMFLSGVCFVCIPLSYLGI